MSNNLKILAVDSDPAQLEPLAALLSAEGFEVVTALDGESAIFAFEEHAPDMVLLERSLPGLDGGEVCEALKERSGNTFIPIVFLANIEHADEKTAGYDAGADDFIVKPYDFKELLARIKSLRKIQGIANRDQRVLTDLSYRSQQRSYDEVMKVVADQLGKEKKTLYRFNYQGMTGYLGTEGFRFVHARLGELTGRPAIEKMLVWPAVQFESVMFVKLRPNVDIDFAEYARWWSSRLDLWRFVAEKLPLKETVLVANGERRDETESLTRESEAVYHLFAQDVPIDEAARKSPLDLAATFKAIGELYYRGLLLRTAPPASTEGDAPPADVLTADPAASGETLQQIEELQLEALTLSGDNQRLQEELAALRQRADNPSPGHGRILEEREQAAATTAARLAELDTAMVALKRRYASRLKDIATKSNDGIMDSVVEQLSMDLQDAHSFAVTVQHSKLNTERQLAAMREEFGSVKDALEEANRRHDRLIQQRQQVNVHEGSRLHQLQGEVSSLKAQLLESSANRQSLQEQLQDASRQSDGKMIRQMQDEVFQLRNQLADAEQQRQALREQLEQAAKNQLAEANKSRELLQQKLAQAVIDENSRIQLYENEIAQLRSARIAADAGSDPEILIAEGAPASEPLQVQLLENKQAELLTNLAELQAAHEQARQALENAETKMLFLEQEAAQLRPALAQSELSLSLFQRKCAEQEGQIAELPNQLATLQAEKESLEARLAEALEQSAAIDPLQDETNAEELALIKAALTESMVKNEQLESVLQETTDSALLETRNAQLKVQALEASLAEAKLREDELRAVASQATDSDTTKSQQLEKELAFVKAKLAELQSSAGAKIQQYEKYSADLKAQLEAATENQALLMKKANASVADSSAQQAVQAETAAMKKLNYELKAEVALLTEKLALANQSANKSALMAKAQELADKFHMLKTTAKEQEAEIARLQAASTQSGGNDGAQKAGEEAQAQVQELTKKIDALRMTLLERDEEIVELTAQLETLETAGN